MGSSQTERKIPIVDLSDANLKLPGSESWELAVVQVRYALEEYGCFEATYGHKVTTKLHGSIFHAAKELFDLPMETKTQKTTTKSGPNYLGQLPNLPLYEAVVVENPATFEGAENFTKIMWPEGNDRFREGLCSFSKMVVELYELATRLVFESYGVAKHHDSHLESILFRIRFFKYRAPKPSESNLGLNTHTDKTFITLLHQHEVEGLQIKSKDDQYIDMKPKPSSFLFMAGDLLKAWSNDRIRTCEHRVIINKARYSLGFQSFVNGLFHVPQEFVDHQNPLRYKPIDHFNFLTRFSIDEALQNSSCAIKAYAGIN